MHAAMYIGLQGERCMTILARVSSHLLAALSPSLQLWASTLLLFSLTLTLSAYADGPGRVIQALGTQASR